MFYVIYKLNGRLYHAGPFDTVQDAEGAINELVNQDGVKREEAVIRRKVK
jgi:hypothetical protein